MYVNVNVFSYSVFFLREHDLRVIRPLVYVREKALRQFVSNENLPVSSAANPNLSKERQRIKQLLTQQEILFPRLFLSLKDALHPLIGKQFSSFPFQFHILGFKATHKFLLKGTVIFLKMNSFQGFK